MKGAAINVEPVGEEDTTIRELRIGLISDTHNLLRPAALAYLQGCDHIVHAGDIMGAEILEQLVKIAPTTAVCGNNDLGSWAQALAETELIRLGEIHLYVLHDLAQLDIDPVGAGVQVVVSGHTHRPLAEERQGVLFVNPGSAGPRRFTLPISLGELRIRGTEVQASIQQINA